MYFVSLRNLRFCSHESGGGRCQRIPRPRPSALSASGPFASTIGSLSPNSFGRAAELKRASEQEDTSSSLELIVGRFEDEETVRAATPRKEVVVDFKRMRRKQLAGFEFKNSAVFKQEQ